MDLLEQFKSIELRFPVENIKAGGIQVWPYLRVYLGDKLVARHDSSVKIGKAAFRQFLRSWHYGFLNFFRGYDYWVFSYTNQRKRVGDQYIDRCDALSKHLDKVLFIELPLPEHRPIRSIPTKHIVSKIFLHFAEAVYARLFIHRVRVMGADILEQIASETGVTLPYQTLVKRYLSQYRLTKLFLRFRKPKAVFMISAYNNVAYMKAIREAGIPVIEFQHGVINDSHFGYNVFKAFDPHFFPDYLLTLGRLEQAVFREGNHYIHRDKVIPVGSFYLDYMAKHAPEDREMSRLKEKYQWIVAITSQVTIESKLIGFLKEAAAMDDSIVYIFIPRYREQFDPAAHDLPDNIILLDHLNTYEIIVHANFHATVYSTCAMEAPSLGIPNIMINIDQLATQYFGNVLHDPAVTKYVDEPHQLVQTIQNFQPSEKTVIQDANKEIILPDFERNLENALERTLQ